MESLKIALTAYGFTIFFALIIAGIIQVLARSISGLNLGRGGEPLDLTVPSADTMKEAEAVAVAVAVARAQAARRDGS